MEITKHINICKCGARIKILDYKTEIHEKGIVVFDKEDLKEVIDYFEKYFNNGSCL